MGGFARGVDVRLLYGRAYNKGCIALGRSLTV